MSSHGCCQLHRPLPLAIRRFAELMSNEGGPHWHPVSNSWSDNIRNVLASTCYLLLGCLVHRCIRCFAELPWVIGRLASGSQATDAEQEEVINAITAASYCFLTPTDGLSAKIAQLMPSREDRDLPSNRRMITNIFSMSVFTNIIVEDRHARLLASVNICTHCPPIPSSYLPCS